LQSAPNAACHKAIEQWTRAGEVAVEPGVLRYRGDHCRLVDADDVEKIGNAHAPRHDSGPFVHGKKTLRTLPKCGASSGTCRWSTVRMLLSRTQAKPAGV